MQPSDISPAHWNERWRIGIDPIDRDHRILASMLSRAQHNLEINNDPLILGRLLADIYDYTRYHFRKEEVLMRVCNYPSRKTHQQAHTQLLTTLEGILQPPFGLDQDDSAQAVFDFLHTWLHDHLVTMDRHYSYYIKGHEQAIIKAIRHAEATNN